MKIKENITKKIVGGEIKIRPKWMFEVERYGLIAAVLAVAVLVGLIMLISIWLIQMGVNLELLEFEIVGKQMFLRDIPWGWLGMFGVGVGIGVVLFSKVGVEYRKSTWMKLLKMMCLVLSALIVLLILRDWFELKLLIKLI